MTRAGSAFWFSDINTDGTRVRNSDLCKYDMQTISSEGLLLRLLHAPPLRGYFELSLYNATLHVSSATINDDIYSELLVYLGSQLSDNRSQSIIYMSDSTSMRRQYIADVCCLLAGIMAFCNLCNTYILTTYQLSLLSLSP